MDFTTDRVIWAALRTFAALLEFYGFEFLGPCLQLVEFGLRGCTRSFGGNQFFPLFGNGGNRRGGSLALTISSHDII
eukprot:scaffold411971_cov47-Attheya_sp.AAC.1